MDLFSFWVPFDVIEKGGQPGVPEEPGLIGGIMSVESPDQQNETIIQAGMDFGYLLSKGWINYEHQPGPENIIGEPIDVTPTTYQGVPATAFRGRLFLDRPRAREVWDAAVAIKKSGSTRRLGYSVEGHTLFRDPADRKRVLKSRILNLAVTAHPVAPDARLEVLAKAASIGYQTPAAGGGSLGPVVPQSLAGSVANVDLNPGRMTVEQFARRLAATLSISYADALREASRIMRSA
jgi:hypothetical protein